MFDDMCMYVLVGRKDWTEGGRVQGGRGLGLRGRHGGVGGYFDQKRDSYVAIRKTAARYRAVGYWLRRRQVGRGMAVASHQESGETWSTWIQDLLVADAWILAAASTSEKWSRARFAPRPPGW